MNKLCELLDEYGLNWARDESLMIPHIVYQQKVADGETIISHNFIIKFCDLLTGKFLATDNLEKAFYDFEKEYFSRYFFREDTDLKWNFYLIIIVNENESANSNICQLEQDDKFMRKLVMTEEEFEVYISHGRNIKDNSKQVISGLDTYAEWQRELSEVGLDGILTCSYESIKVQNYIEKNTPIRSLGRPTQNWKNTGKGSDKFLVEKIEALKLDEFRNHCFSDHMEIPLTNVNLISGCNGAGKSSICSAIEYALTGEILDSREEKGKAEVRIRNHEGAYAKLDSTKATKDKKALDQLWYGTVTTARNSSLNRNFHTFNYLGLEASGKYMRELDINELVKNVLFGLEVTEAELKMQRYKRAFADKRKEYGKRLKEISQEIDGLQVDYDIAGFSIEEINKEFQRLGYKKEFILKDQVIDSMLSNWRRILLENNQYVEMLLLKCDKEETGTAIMEKMKEKSERRERYRSLKARREELKQSFQNLYQKVEDSHLLLKKLYDKIQKVQMMILKGRAMGNIFFCKQDFQLFANEYEKNRNIREALLNWVDQYQIYIHADGNEAEINMKMHNKEVKISELGNEIEELVRQIELQKNKNDNIDTIIQEILNLAEQYSELNESAEKCPVCGTNFASREKLMKAISDQKLFRVIDETQLLRLLGQKAEAERCYDAEKASLKLLKEEKEKILQKRIAISRLKGIMSIDETQNGTDIQREVVAYIEQIQENLERNINKYNYVQGVFDTDLFVDYSEEQDWIIYLEESLQNLEIQKTEAELLLKEQTNKQHELKLEYQKIMDEDIFFSEPEWEECQLKANGFQELCQTWEIDENMPVISWLDQYIVFRNELQYAEEMYGRQEALKLKRGRIEKLKEEKRVVEERIQNCQRAYEVIERQKHLEDVMKEFLVQNAKQIELFFKLLHRPKEFGKLSIEDGNIRFMRNSNGQLAESGQMSTGQRMALAFSVMITLHIRAANAPNFLMLDEPVANLDDMHVLNLIDLLRELAISGTQIIITTADSQMAKFLRRKFSFLKDEYSHFELHRKGNAHTLIDVIHYSPDMKAAKNIKNLS